MRFNIEILGSKLAVEIWGLRRLYITTTGHEFAYCRDEWFQNGRGEWRRWTLERA